jgi:16S rRNA (guanine(966)-N(2))-methyltransferase RsmD
MRVITGSARGRKLQTLPGEDIVRPTSQRVKESMFSAVQFVLENTAVLDAFAGSGQLGIEALSRGAHSAVFCERESAAVVFIKKNLQICDFADRSDVRVGDTLHFMRSTRLRFDFIFLDPPYKSGLLADAIPLAGALLTEKGVILCAAPQHEPMPDIAGQAVLSKIYKHGKTKVVLYRVPTESEAT